MLGKKKVQDVVYTGFLLYIYIYTHKIVMKIHKKLLMVCTVESGARLEGIFLPKVKKETLTFHFVYVWIFLMCICYFHSLKTKSFL